ncbi:MAG TPA: bifunctional folylpolyglutamate synthase/dihydrofolate synthase [Candidatus Pullichristensenella avicola]|nr:bifunctional folylpolyglutamate synthase/dihydrofolate synthase [Candidatus Pullichristensenella avicola]
MNANQAIEWIHSRRYTGHKHGLENTRALLAALGNPERGFLSLHIAGTNGKGSTAAMCAACLQKSGYRTGLYTSPYLENYRERIRVAGQCIPEADLVRGVREIMAACATLERSGVFPTTFEIGTALAFWHFREAGVQVAVVECGLGGRLDCTNVVTPVVSMIAAIGMDHMAQLGDTLGAIAREKAGIIKPGVPAVVMRQSEEILGIFREKGEIIVAEDPQPLEITPYGSRFRLPFGEFSIRLPGRHQMRNASLALYGLRASGLRLANLEEGLRSAEWPGRLEWLGETLLDGAHNPQGARTLRDYLCEHFANADMTLITGMMRDKQIDECAAILAPLFPRVVATRVNEPRAAEPERVAAAYAAFGCETRTAESVEEALRAVSGARVVAGSLYLVGAARALLKGESVWNFTTSRCS